MFFDDEDESEGAAAVRLLAAAVKDNDNIRDIE